MHIKSIRLDVKLLEGSSLFLLWIVTKCNPIKYGMKDGEGEGTSAVRVIHHTVLQPPPTTSPFAAVHVTITFYTCTSTSTPIPFTPVWSIKLSVSKTLNLQKIGQLNLLYMSNEDMNYTKKSFKYESNQTRIWFKISPN